MDIRIIAATNRDLEAEVKAGRFREDLYYRLNVVPIHLPPLRERKEDIPELVQYFLQRSSKETGRNVKTVSSEALEKLRGYDWPGNVRELANLIERAVVLGQGETVTLGDLPPLGVAGSSAGTNGMGSYHEAIHTTKRVWSRKPCANPAATEPPQPGRSACTKSTS